MKLLNIFAILTIFFGTQIPHSSFAQSAKVVPTTVTVGAIDTEAGQKALSFALKRIADKITEKEDAALIASCGPNSSP